MRGAAVGSTALAEAILTEFGNKVVRAVPARTPSMDDAHEQPESDDAHVFLDSGDEHKDTGCHAGKGLLLLLSVALPLGAWALLFHSSSTWAILRPTSRVTPRASQRPT